MFSRSVAALAVLAMVPLLVGGHEGNAPALAVERFGALPLRFEPNVGQFDDRVRFVARAPGYTLFLTSDEAVFALGKGEAVVRMGLVGAATDPAAEGEDALPGVTNYFLGSDPAKWRTGIVSYARVRYREVYEGIDLVYYGTPRDLEYDFVVAPGADPSAIRLRIDGADRVTLDERGDLVLSVGRGELRQRAPVIYQEGPAGREHVSGGYVVAGDRVSFAIGDYDASRPLVVDPVVAYSRDLSGSGHDWAEGIAIGPDGSAYVAGNTYSTDFPTVAPFQPHNAFGEDTFVTKLDPSGEIVYSTYLGGNSSDFIWALAVGADGSAYVTGSTQSANFPIVAQFQPIRSGGYDAFVTRLAPSGAALTYSTYLGGSLDDRGLGIAAGADGSAYVTGVTSSANFPTATPFQASRAGLDDVFVTKLSASGTSLAYSTYLGGNGFDYGNGIAVGADGSAYVTGSTGSTNFPTVAPLMTSLDFNDAFVTKLSPSGTSLAYSTYLGSTSSDSGYAIALGGDGSAYVAGSTSSAGFPTVGPLQGSYAGGGDAFVAKLAPSGSALVYSTFLGGSDGDEANAIGLDTDGNIYVAGTTWSTDFPTAAPVQATNAGGPDAFVAKVSTSGLSLAYSTYLGDDLEDYGLAIAVGADGSAHVAGQTGEIFDGYDAFVTKLSGLAGSTPGIYVPATGTFFLKNASAAGAADLTFAFGVGGLGYVPLTGDWNGDGVDTIGLYHPPTGVFFLKNTNASGPADLTFTFGVGGVAYVPLAGDWDGDGTDTVGLYQPATGVFFLRNANAGGAADVTFTFGVGGAGYVPVAGDWDGDGDDTVGLYDPAASVFFLRNANGNGPADVTFSFGVGGLGYVPVMGDWDGDGDDTAGLYRPSTAAFFLRNLNLPGPADLTFVYGPPNASPLAGDWNGV
jgi:hypothetical protein